MQMCVNVRTLDWEDIKTKGGFNSSIIIIYKAKVGWWMYKKLTDSGSRILLPIIAFQNKSSFSTINIL